MPIPDIIQNSAALHVNDAVCHRRNRLIVRDDDNRCTPLSAQLIQHLQHCLASFKVKGTRRFITQQQ